MVYFEVQKTIDSVPCYLLLIKLASLGFDSDFIKLLKSYLNCRKQEPNLNNIFSNEAYIASGVLLGSVLGPLLFILFINDMTTHLSTLIFIAKISKFLGSRNQKTLKRY